jgi:phage gpG-like protein
MPDASFTLTGDKRLHRQLGDLSHATRGKMLMRALVSGALLAVNEAKRLAPYETGNLRRSLHVGGEGAAGGLEGDTTGTDIGGQESRRDWAEVSVGTNVEYAARLEFGFAGTESLGRTFDQLARPYLRPAVEATKDDVQREIAGAVRAQLRRAVR